MTKDVEMGFFDKVSPPTRKAAPPDVDRSVLSLAPAVARMSISGKDAGAETEALAAAVSKADYPAGVTPARVFAIASELTRMIQVEGLDGLNDRMLTGLDPEARIAAMRVALVATLTSPLADDGDIAVLARIAGRIGMGEAEFAALLEAAKAQL